MNNIGIDKTVVKNLKAESIDISTLKNNDSEYVRVIASTESSFDYITTDGKSKVQNVLINDRGNMFNTLSIGVKLNGNTKIQYVILDLAITSKGENNLIPLSIGAYKQRISEVAKYIGERYGIMLNEKESKLEKVELNATIEIDEKFNKYLRTLDILTSVAPNYYKQKERISIDNEVCIFKGSNKSISFKFYDKTKQLADVYNDETSKNVLRIEYTLKSAKKIIDVFGHNEVNKLTDTEIKEFIKNQFKKDFLEPYYKQQAINQKELVKLSNISNKKSQWKIKLMDSLVNEEVKSYKHMIFDVNELQQIVKSLDSRHFKRNWIQTLERAPSCLTGIDEKVEEIAKKIEEI